MTQTADLPFTPRERLRWQRARDARLADAIFGCVVRDATTADPIFARPAPVAGSTARVSAASPG